MLYSLGNSRFFMFKALRLGLFCFSSTFLLTFGKSPHKSFFLALGLSEISGYLVRCCIRFSLHRGREESFLWPWIKEWQTCSGMASLTSACRRSAYAGAGNKLSCSRHGGICLPLLLTEQRKIPPTPVRKIGAMPYQIPRPHFREPTHSKKSGPFRANQRRLELKPGYMVNSKVLFLGWYYTTKQLVKVRVSCNRVNDIHIN